MKGLIILRTTHLGVMVTLTMPIHLSDPASMPMLHAWAFEEMDRALYERIGHIPREREWEVVAA